MKMSMKKIINEWEGNPSITHNFTFRIETPEHRKKLEDLLRSDKSIISLSYDCKSDDREVILMREIK